MFGLGGGKGKHKPLATSDGSAPSADGASTGTKADLDNVVFWSVMSGCCPLIPLPVVDGICGEAVRHLMVLASLKRHGFETSLPAVHSLSSKEPPTCAQCGMKVAYYGCGCFLLEFCFKKICFVFTVKNCVEDASELFHQGWLLLYAIKTGALQQGDLGNKLVVWRVSTAINKACSEVDTSPLDKVFKKILDGNTGKMGEAASTVQSSLSEHGISGRCCPRIGACCGTEKTKETVVEAMESAEKDARDELGGVTESLAQEIRAMTPYLQKVEGVFTKRLKELQDSDAQPSGVCCCA